LTDSSATDAGNNCQDLVFGRFAEAVEVTAIERVLKRKAG
jgi:hypothetical protein